MWDANTLGHDVNFVLRPSWAVARHEQAKGTVGKALSTLEGEQIRLEPFVLGTARRNDIRITGPQPSSISTQELDLAIVYMASQQARSTCSIPETKMTLLLILKRLLSSTSTWTLRPGPRLLLSPQGFHSGPLVE